MDDETVARTLDAIERGEKLVQATAKLLAEQGYLNLTEATDLESLEPEYLTVSISESGEQLLKRRRSLTG